MLWILISEFCVKQISVVLLLHKLNTELNEECAVLLQACFQRNHMTASKWTPSRKNNKVTDSTPEPHTAMKTLHY